MSKFLDKIRFINMSGELVTIDSKVVTAKEFDKAIGNCIKAVFNITSIGTTITLQNLVDKTIIDWGDGTINNNTLSHVYTAVGNYTCYIYGVTSIGESAFYNCSALTSVTIGNGVTNIWDYTFYGCSGLTSVIIGNGVTSIGQRAFYGCSGLTSVTIGNGVTSIGQLAFYNCSGLTSVMIPISVTSIGDSAFQYCTKLTSIMIPISVTSIGGYAFYGCSLLTIYFEGASKPAGWASNFKPSGRPIYYECKNIDPSKYILLNDISSVAIDKDKVFQISVDEEIIFNIVTLLKLSIPEQDFTVTVKNLEFIDGTPDIDWGDGENGELLTHTYAEPGPYICSIYSLTNIGTDAFENMSTIEDVKISKDVTSIGNGAFRRCENLTSVAIWNGVTSIGDEAFFHCSALTSVTIPDSVTSIGYSAFQYCQLTSIAIPDSVTRIEVETFAECVGLTSVTIPDSVTSIRSAAFQLCTRLTSVTIGNGVTEIYPLAFDGCSALTSITIKATTPPALLSVNAFSNTNNCPIYVPAASVNTYKAATNWASLASRIQAIPV